MVKGRFIGSAGVCINGENKVLMVLQSTRTDRNSRFWALPSGSKETNETFEECCIREFGEETGYIVKVEKKIKDKIGISNGFKVNVKYFKVEILGGKPEPKDPDDLIFDVDWKSIEEIKTLNLSYAEDRVFLINYLSSN